MAWSPQGHIMYYVDSPARCIYAFDVDQSTICGLANKRVFASTAPYVPEDAVPDGLTVDSEGGVWVAMWNGGCVLCFRADGTLERAVRLPVSRPTAVAFGGPGLRTLYVTSCSRDKMQALPLPQEPLAGSLFSIETEVSGLPERETA
mmetsp:Transcript_37713/g.119075  ORF Transcript_37713/g.119075 Transcript_37713/m.119075 type:complete len:147 (+) Transcript_37713:630-1070(+)